MDRREGVGVRPFRGIAGMGEGLRVTVGPVDAVERFLAALDAAFPELPADPGTRGATHTDAAAEAPNTSSKNTDA